jgi:DNA mismatch endonuclease, patch repair protein
MERASDCVARVATGNIEGPPVRSSGTNADSGGGWRSPSFKGFTAASEASAKSKRKNRSTCTVHEAQLRSLLWRRGLRFRKNLRSLEGKPDIVFIRQLVVIFCDGDFWHGRKWRQLLGKLSAGHNSQYWVKKIQTNRERDRRTNSILRRSGWLVLRFWETDIQRTPGDVVQKIIDALQVRCSTSKPWRMSN